MTYEADSYYATITEKFKRLDGKSSWYNCFSGNGQFTVRLRTGHRSPTKAQLIDLIHKELQNSDAHIDKYTRTETEYGVRYERFMKTSDDLDVYEQVNEGEHTDHEVFIVEVFYMYQDTDIFRKLEQREKVLLSL